MKFYFVAMLTILTLASGCNWLGSHDDESPDYDEIHFGPNPGDG